MKKKRKKVRFDNPNKNLQQQKKQNKNRFNLLGALNVWLMHN